MLLNHVIKDDIFQSTLPVRGATEIVRGVWGERRNFNPRSPCGERHDESPDDRCNGEFQSTLPVRGATDGDVQDSRSTLISIHAPRAGSDERPAYTAGSFEDFNPRSPCGERHVTRLVHAGSGKFQSTLPVRGATTAVRSHIFHIVISIHAPRAGSDFCFYVNINRH